MTDKVRIWALVRREVLAAVWARAEAESRSLSGMCALLIERGLACAPDPEGKPKKGTKR